MNSLISFVDRFGIVFIAILAFSEYLNVPIIPGGIACAAAGVLIRLGYAGLPEMLIILFVASILAELAVYYASFFFSDKVRNFCLNHARTAKAYEKTTNILEKYGAPGLFIARLIPIMRTFISIPAGLMKMKLSLFIPVSLAGNAVHALSNIALGYFFTSFFLN